MEELHRYGFRAMGAPCGVQLYGGAEETGRIAEVAIAEVRRLETKYSRYRDDSVASAINRTAGDAGGMAVDAETAVLLDYADTAWRQSGGLFDVTSGVLRRAWDFRSGRLPEPDAVAALLEQVGWHRVGWDGERIALPVASMEIDFGGYVKEYAADRAAPWRVGIRHPRVAGAALAWIPLASGAIATSGDYERSMVVDGRRYGHILDPRTGWPVEGLMAASVVAPHCVVAGTATTIALLQPAEAGRAWLAELGLPHLCVDRALRPHGSLAGVAGGKNDGATGGKTSGVAGGLPEPTGAPASVAGQLVHG